jgi:hypothetical protein
LLAEAIRALILIAIARSHLSAAACIPNASLVGQCRQSAAITGKNAANHLHALLHTGRWPRAMMKFDKLIGYSEEENQSQQSESARRPMMPKHLHLTLTEPQRQELTW